MPAQQRVRPNEEQALDLAAQQSARRGEEHPVSLIQLRTSDLAAKNRELVAQNHDLELPELTRAQTQRRHRERAPKHQIQERDHQERLPPGRERKNATLRSRGCRRATAAAATQYASDGFTYLAGISLGGIIVILGIILMFVWSFWIGLIVALVGLIAFGGFARGKWY
jgi:hypothetical protein